jgi:hypothetical protein
VNGRDGGGQKKVGKKHREEDSLEFYEHDDFEFTRLNTD